MQWIKTDDIQSGDIIETVSKIPDHSPICKGWFLPIIKHYGMVANVDGERCIVHNIIGKQPTITPFEEVFADRDVERVLRTGMKDEEILERFEACRNIKYSLFDFNCENLMVYITGSNIGFPQQEAYGLGFAVLLVIIIIILISK